MPINAEKIDENGWRQGSAFSIADSACLMQEHGNRPQLPGVALGAEARLMVVSHSCEIVHPRDQEPLIDVIPAKPLPPGAKTEGAGHGRIARRLRLPVQIANNEILHELHAPLRFPIARERLEELKPDPTAALSREALRDLTYWLALRYRRRVFPTEFDRRLGEGHNRIRRLIRRIEPVCAAFLYSLNTDCELPSSEVYRLRLVLVVRASALDDDRVRASCDQVIDALEAIFDGIGGIEADIHLRSDTQFSLAERMSFESWGLEDLSIEVDNEPPPVEHG